MPRTWFSTRTFRAAALVALAFVALVASGCGKSSKSGGGQAQGAEEGSQACVSVVNTGKLCGDDAKAWCKSHPDRAGLTTGDCESIIGKEAVNASGSTECSEGEYAVYSHGGTLLRCIKKGEEDKLCTGDKVPVPYNVGGKQGWTCEDKPADQRYQGPSAPESGGSTGGGTSSGSTGGGTSGGTTSGGTSGGSTGGGTSGGSTGGGTTGPGTQHNYPQDQCLPTDKPEDCASSPP